MTPLLDYAGMLETNVVRRVRALSSTPATEGVVLVAYGDATYLREWNELLTRLGDRLRRDLGIDQTTHAWCGHLVHYEQGPTQQAIRDLLAVKQRALVVPVLVAVDEMFQHRIIGGAIDSMPERERVVYKPDAILPEPAIEAWVVDAVRAAVATDAKVAAGDR
jgi:hypothetical protein